MSSTTEAAERAAERVFGMDREAGHVAVSRFAVRQRSLRAFLSLASGAEFRRVFCATYERLREEAAS